MFKKILLSLVLFGISVFGYSQNRVYVAPWVQKIFLDFNLLYNYEKLTTDNDFTISSNNMLFEIALGYDFGRIVPRVFFDIGLPLYGTVGFDNGDQSLTEVMDTKNLKTGFEAGIKALETEKVDLIIPLGIALCYTTYTQKNPGYVNGHPYDRVWDYSYLNLFSGLTATFRISNHFKVGVFSQFGFPVKREYEYKETLRGNYMWSDSQSRTRSIKREADVFTFSAGIGILGNL